LRTCFFEHVRDGECKEEVLRAPLGKLAEAFASAHHRELFDFVCRDSDGLGNPLPGEACLNLGLAVAYWSDTLPEYNKDVVIARDLDRRARRAHLQRLHRSARRLGLSLRVPRMRKSTTLPSHRNSTIHLVTGALVIKHFTGCWHYRQQTEMLNLMGLSRGQDFVRDRVDFLRGANTILFESIESWARAIKERAAG